MLPEAGHDSVAHHVLGGHKHVVVRLVHLQLTQFLPDVTPVRILVASGRHGMCCPLDVTHFCFPLQIFMVDTSCWQSALPDDLCRHVGTAKL